MSTLPDNLRAYLQQRLEASQPASFSVDRHGLIESLQGDCAVYGITEEAIGKPAAEVFSVAAGEEMEEGATAVFECINIEGVPIFDMHIFGRAQGFEVLLQHTQSQVTSMHELQQRLNETSLKYEHLRTSGDAASQLDHTFHQLLFGMDFFVLERVAENQFHPIGILPEWLKSWYPELAVFATSNPAERIPYLEYFLQQARPLWSSPSTSKALYSGIWQEEQADGERMHFRARTLNIDDRNLLIIECAPEEVREKQNLLQAARQAALHHSKLQREVKKKEVLLHCIVHDLRSPLTSMLGSLEMMKEEEDPHERDELIAIGINQAERQSQMIDQILHAFAAEIDAWDREGITADEAPQLVEVLQSVQRANRAACESKGIRLLVELDDERETIQAFGDAPQLERILNNLLENARRFTPRGSAIRMKLDQTCIGDQDWARIRVEDEGPGVPAAHRDTLFQQFKQGQNAGSIGLGLYYCKITLNKWDGEISYYQPAGGGAGFELRLRPFGEDHVGSPAEEPLLV